jgi:hypothetical protein
MIPFFLIILFTEIHQLNNTVLYGLEQTYDASFTKCLLWLEKGNLWTVYLQDLQTLFHALFITTFNKILFFLFR